jgi:hypothetical protein
MHISLAICVGLFLGLVGPADALYEENGPVKLLGPETFKEVVVDSDLPALVEFFAPYVSIINRSQPVVSCIPTVCSSLLYRMTHAY